MVLSLGGIAREMLAVAGRKGNHFVSLDAMGQTVSVALGLALGLENSDTTGKVIAVEGDGSLLMGLSVLSTVGHLKPRRLLVYVLDNGVYLATGGQPTAAADIDLVAVTAGCGWHGARDVSTAAELADATAWALAAAGPVLIRVRTRYGAAARRVFPGRPGHPGRGLPALAAIIHGHPRSPPRRLAVARRLAAAYSHRSGRGGPYRL